VTKASKVVAALLQVIAPGNAGALWKATKRSKIVDKVLESMGWTTRKRYTSKQ
jgi:hypothetical protein